MRHLSQETRKLFQSDMRIVVDYLAEGMAAGRAEGIVAGRIEGENRFARLVQMLMEGGRNEDLQKAVSDQSYREQLYMEVNLI